MRFMFPWLLLAGLLWGQHSFSADQKTAAASDASRTMLPEAVAPPLPSVVSAPSPKSRIDFFRQLLSLPAAERERALANKSDKQKEYIKTKLREYEALAPDEREVRLRLVQVYSYLSPLMRMTPTNRTAYLALVPAEDRPIIAERLWHWDKLPPASQKEVLDHENTLQLFVWFGAGPPSRPAEVVPKLTPEQRNKHEEDLERWNRQSLSRRREMLGTFKEFLNQPNQEREKTLKVR